MVATQYKTRTRKGPVCDGCKKHKRIFTRDFQPDYPLSPTKSKTRIVFILGEPLLMPGDWKPQKWCLECFVNQTISGVDKSRADEAKHAKFNAFRASLGGPAKRQRKGGTGRTRSSLSTGETNKDLVRRLIKEGKDKAEVRRTLRDLYTAQGKTDDTWIKKRIRRYLKWAKRTKLFKPTLAKNSGSVKGKAIIAKQVAMTRTRRKKKGK